MLQNRAILTCKCDSSLWSCCWDTQDPNLLYAGEASGGVTVFDIRNHREPLRKLTVPGDSSPVVSLASAKWGGAMPLGGLLCCKLSSCWAFRKVQADDFYTVQLPIEGPFMSLTYDNSTGHVLVSARPSQRHAYTRHSVCELRSDEDSNMRLNVIHEFIGAPIQRLLSRSCFLTVKNKLYAAAYHETDTNVAVWSIDEGCKVSSVPAHLPVLDLCSISSPLGQMLVSLNEKKLDFFNVVAES